MGSKLWRQIPLVVAALALNAACGSARETPTVERTPTLEGASKIPPAERTPALGGTEAGELKTELEEIIKRWEGREAKVVYDFTTTSASGETTKGTVILY